MENGGMWENTKYAFKFWFRIFFRDLITILTFFIALGIIFGPSVTAVVIGNVKPKDLALDLGKIVFGVIVSLAVSTFTGLIHYFSKYDEILQKFYREFNRLPFFIDSVSEIVNSLINLDSKKVEGILKIFSGYKEPFGGIMISADEKKYIEYLKELVPATNKSFYATLRGGVKPAYTIDWFFKDSTRDGVVILSAEEKQKYLRLVNDASIRKKVRIIILKNEEMEAFCDNNIRNEFFKLNTEVEVYLIDPDELRTQLLKSDVSFRDQKITHELETTFIWEDYAIFDESICVKHNGQYSLYLGVTNQIAKMCLPFKLLEEHPEIFKKLDKKGIYEYDSSSRTWNLEENWVAWKARKCRQRRHSGSQIQPHSINSY